MSDTGNGSGAPLFNTVPLNGPLFVGTIINWLLFGVQLNQVYDYSWHYQEDKWPIKLLVYGLLSLDIAQTGLSTRFSWLFLVQGWGDLHIFDRPSWTGPTMPVMAGTVALIVQQYYAWRIWCLGGRRLKQCAAFIVLLSLMQFVAAFVSSMKFEFQDTAIVGRSLVPGFTIWLVGSFLCDCVVAGCMLIICRKAKMQTSFETTSTILNQVIRNVVETAAVTAFCAGGQLVCFLAFRNSSLSYLTPAYLLGKLYSNCLMANLNNRKMLRPSELGHNSSHGGLHSNDVVHIRDASLPQRSKSPSPMTVIAVKRISDVHLGYTTKGDNEENVCA
ncbi:hypothetical protein SCHPADRAFT_155436 [Schizopora paradoxa]|uniref:DUF6534 domain-containing protein n=1 Tax=Schizopora paradoxa TaxID=27342 RepID=A0A0H2S007_9AGAM|nr:hypothetical protein SCHPADRAFT_155436 [Schizopora paradoxa]